MTLVKLQTVLAVIGIALLTSVNLSARDYIVRPGRGRLESVIEKAGDGDRILLRPGTYRIGSTLELEGVNGLNVEPLKKGSNVVITGSVRIPRRTLKQPGRRIRSDRGSKAGTRAGLVLPSGMDRSVRILDLSAFPGVAAPHTAGYGHKSLPAWSFMFHGDSLMNISRWPSDAYVHLDSIISCGVSNYKDDLDGSCSLGRFTIAEDLPDWSMTDMIMMRGCFAMGWSEEILPLGSISAGGLIEFADTTTYGLGAGKDYQRFYFFNIPEEVDEPGEYAIDGKQQVAYVCPPRGCNALELAVLDKPLIELRGCKDIVISGISFSKSRGDGIVMKNCANVTVESCELSGLGHLGVLIDRDCRRCGLRSCELHHIASGAVELLAGDRASLERGDCFVEDCHIHNFNFVESGYRPAVKFNGVGNRVSACCIHDSDAQGILLNGNDQTVEGCELYRLCMNIEDNGAIYYGRNPTERGSVVRDNYFHDLISQFNIRAIYHDDGACACLVIGNVFRNISTPPIQIGGGSDIVYRNNLFMDIPCAAIKVDARLGTWAAGLLDTINERLAALDLDLYCRHYPEFASYIAGDKAVPKGNVLENNIFYDVEHVFERVVNDDHWFNDDMGKDVNFFSSVSGNVITDVLPQYELPHLKYGNLK